MRRVIRSAITQAFLGKGGLWTDSIDDAEEFADYSQATARKKELNLRDVELFYYSEGDPSKQNAFAVWLG